MNKSDKIHIDIYRHTYNIDGDRNIIGDLHINSILLDIEQFFCYTLEDEIRADGVKNYGVTAIKADTYEIEVTWSHKFKRNMILIKNVPQFSGIRIHGGNSSKDSLGCPLVAYNTDYKKIWKTSEKALTELVQSAGGKGTVTIHNSPMSYDKVNHKKFSL